MELSPKGALLIGVFEAIALKAYPDGDHPSVGLGDNDKELRPGDEITIEEAFRRFRKAILIREAELQRKLRVPLKQHEYDALFSMYYQSGNRYVPKIADLINRHDWQGAIDLWPECAANKRGVMLAGLRKRRLREVKLFETGDYGDLSTIKIFRGDPHKTKPELWKVPDGWNF